MAWRLVPCVELFRPCLVTPGPHLHLLLSFINHRRRLAALVVEISLLTLDGLRVQHKPTPYRTQDRGRKIIVLKIAITAFFSNPPWGDSYIIQLSWRFVRGVSSIEAPGTGSMAWVAKGNKIIFDFICLCPSTVSCLRGRLVRPTARQFQKPHVVPNVPHDL